MIIYAFIINFTFIFGKQNNNKFLNKNEDKLNTYQFYSIYSIFNILNKYL